MWNVLQTSIAYYIITMIQHQTEPKQHNTYKTIPVSSLQSNPFELCALKKSEFAWPKAG
jgi:hypothetical protein